jgi:hypothetical protein
MQLHGWHGRARLWATAILVGGASWLAFGGAVPTATASTQMASAKVAHLAVSVTQGCPPFCGSGNPGGFVAIAVTPSGGGYWLAQAGGGIYSFGDAHFYGSLPQAGVSPAAPVVGMAASDGGGYWLVGSDGGIFAFGDAHFYGSTGNLRLNKAVVGMAATPDGHGYWLVAADGGVFAFGDAVFYGSTGSLHLNKPIVGMTTDGTGLGYWLVAADGGIFNFGDAQFHGSTGSIHLSQPMVGMAFSPNLGGGSHGPGDFAGYWLAAADGGIFSLGNAIFHGSAGGLHLNQPIVGMAATPDGQGYWLVGSDGGIFSFGDAGFHGSATGPPPACVGSQFAAAVTTSGSTFAKGQTIPITLSITNVGQPCESFGGGGNADVLEGCPYLVATNASGQSVWNSTANTDGGSACGAGGAYGAIPTGWSQTYPFSWNQLQCPVSGSGCTQIQAPPGNYTIAFGEPNDIWVGVTVKPAIVSIG